MTSLMTENPKNSSRADNIAAVAGPGTIYITAAKIWFVVSGAAIHFVLPRFLTPEQFGMYEVVVYVVSIVNAVIITATYQSVSKRISEDEANAGAVKAKALKLQVLVGGGASLGFFLLAPVIAGYLNDLRLVPYLRFASLFTLAINLLQRIDLIMVKTLSSADASVASENAGYYGAAINVANVTHQAIVSATFVIFPLISQSTFAKDREKTRTYITNTLRYTLMVMALIATLFS